MHPSTSDHRSGLSADLLLVDCARHARDGLNPVITDELERQRAVYLRNTGMTALGEMSGWAQHVGIRQMDYEGDTGNRFDMGAGVLPVGTEPAHTSIDPLPEMACWHYCPQCVMFGCKQAPASGGETVIASKLRVSRVLENTATGSKLFDIGIHYIRNYADRDHPDSIPSTSSWRASFACADRNELERRCAERGWRPEHRRGGAARISWLEQGFEYDEKSVSHLFFTRSARLGKDFEDWPPNSGLDNGGRPYHVTCADGSECSARDLATLDSACARYSIPFEWQPGDIAVLENIAWTHSRPPYRLAPGEQRKIGILVANHRPRRRQLRPGQQREG